MLRVSLLGPPRVEYDGNPVEIARTQTRALLFRLAADLQPVPREQLAFLLWPDVPDAAARRNLSHRLSLLCRDLPDPDALLTMRDVIQLDQQRTWSDTVEFSRLGARQARGRRLEDLQHAVALYRGPFLDGFSPPKGGEFERWLNERRQVYEHTYRDALLALVEGHAAAGAFADAIIAAQKHLTIDEVDEEMHRRLIQLYVMSGDYSAALHQYERCAAIVRRELDASPQAETEALHRALLAGRQPRHHSDPAQPDWRTHSSLQLPLVGREDALAELRRDYRSARISQGQIVLIAGEPGIGKTRLMQDFAQSLGTSEALVLVGSSQRATQTTPYQLIVEAFRNHLQSLLTETRDVSKDKALAERFPGGISFVWLAEASRVLPELRAMVPGLPEPDDSVGREVIRVRVVEALYRLLIALANPLQTVVLFLDDLQWADRATLSWLVYVAGRIRNQRLLVVGAYRRGEADRLASFISDLSRQRQAIEMELPGWDEATTGRALFHITGIGADRRQIGALGRRLHIATQGNPFFVLAMMQELAESGQLARDWTSETDLPVPDTVRAVLQRRIRRLTPAARQVLEAGAVLGFRFDFDLVLRTAGGEEMEIANGLEELVSRQFVDALPHDFRFHHELIRETVYRGLDEWRRHLLHRRAAASLEALHEHDRDAVSPQLAFHYASANLPAQAVPFYERAAEAALRLHAVHEGINLLRPGLALLARLPASQERDRLELKMQLDLGLAMMMAEESSAPEIRQIYERAERVAAQLGDDYGRFLALDGLHDFCNRLSARSEGYEIVKELLVLARRFEDPPKYARTLLRLAIELYNSGEIEAAREAIEQILAVMGERAEMQEYHHHAFARTEPIIDMVHGVILHWLGYAEQARVKLSEAITLGSQRFPYGALIVIETYSRINMEQGDVEQALARVAEMNQIGSRYGLPYARSHCQFVEGWAAVQQGQIEHGLATIRQALAELKLKKRLRGILYYECILAREYLRTGRYEAGLAVVDESLASADELVQRPAEPELLRVKGELLAAGGADAGDVERYYQDALEMARSQHARFYELRAIMSLNRLYQATGNDQQQGEARRQLAEAYDWFSEGFDTLELRQARAMLDGEGAPGSAAGFAG